MKNFIVAAISILFLMSCGNDDPFFFEDDFSTVPDPFSVEGITPDTTETGLIIYILEEGNGPLKVGIRDQVEIFFTGRTVLGEIFDSSYKNGRETPSRLTVASLIEGFTEGILDMNEGGKRVLVIPPELGYAGTTNELRNDTLVFDIELDSVIF